MNKSLIALAVMATASLTASAQKMNIKHRGDTTVTTVINSTRYLLLPIQEEKDEAQVLLDTGSPEDTWMDVRLSHNGLDYYVPFSLKTQTNPNHPNSPINANTAMVKIVGLPKDVLAVNLMKLSDTFDTTNTDFYRPAYHFTPAYGWMNDPNGMVYKDSEYHLRRLSHRVLRGRLRRQDLHLRR